MRRRRLRWLLVLLCTVIGVRWLAPPLAPEPAAVSEAVVRGSITPRQVDASSPSFTRVSAPEAAALLDADEPSNAFAVRAPARSVALSPAFMPPAVAIAPPPAEPIEAPPPPMQVIGTWDDGAQPGIFLSTPQGTRLARAGDLLLAEYRVAELTNRQVTLQHVPTSRELRLAIPQGAAR